MTTPLRSSEAMAEKLASIREAFLSSAGDQLAEMLSLAEDLQGAHANASEPRERLRRLAHSLAGRAGTFGFPEVSAAAARLEDEGEGSSDAALAELTRETAASISQYLQAHQVSR